MDIDFDADSLAQVLAKRIRVRGTAETGSTPDAMFARQREVLRLLAEDPDNEELQRESEFWKGRLGAVKDVHVSR